MTSRVANAAVGASIATEIGELRRHGSPGGVDLVLELLNCLTVVAREVDLEALGVAAAAFDEDKVGSLVLAAPAPARDCRCTSGAILVLERVNVGF